MEELERRIAMLEEQVSALMDQRKELALIRVAVDNHTAKHGDHTVKLDVLIDGQAAIMAILRSRGQA